MSAMRKKDSTKTPDGKNAVDSVAFLRAEPYRPERGLKRLESLRRQLLEAAVRHVHEGTGPVPERLREASDRSGIPLVLIKAEAER